MLCFVGFSQDTVTFEEPLLNTQQEVPMSSQPTIQSSPQPANNNVFRMPGQKNPKLAGWLSTALPGAGQVYNGQWWKVPIIYGGAYGLFAIGQFNYRERNFYQAEYRARVNLPGAEANLQTAIQQGQPQYTIDSLTKIVDDLIKSKDPKLEIYRNDQILSARDYYRRNLELVYIFSGVLYLLNIIDAVVFAHLATFDVGDNLTMRVQPFASPDLSLYALQNQRVPMQGGLRLTFTLK